LKLIRILAKGDKDASESVNDILAQVSHTSPAQLATPLSPYNTPKVLGIPVNLSITTPGASESSAIPHSQIRRHWPISTN
jgi:hypothetical protein